MISLEEYFGLYGLDENEVAAISEHEHIPDIAAAAFVVAAPWRRDGPNHDH